MTEQMELIEITNKMLLIEFSNIVANMDNLTVAYFFLFSCMSQCHLHPRITVVTPWVTWPSLHIPWWPLVCFYGYQGMQKFY